MDDFAEKLTTAIKDAITHTTPRKKPSPHSKRWWNDDLTNLRKTINPARNRYRRIEMDQDEAEWKNMRSRYKMEIRIAKEKKWREFIEETDERTIGMAKMYIDKPPIPYYISAVNNATSNNRKANSRRHSFPHHCPQH